MFRDYYRLFVEVAGQGVSAVQSEKIIGLDDGMTISMVRKLSDIRKKGNKPFVVHDIGLIKVTPGNGGACAVIEVVDSFVYLGDSEFISNARDAWISEFKEKLLNSQKQ